MDITTLDDLMDKLQSTYLSSDVVAIAVARQGIRIFVAAELARVEAESRLDELERLPGAYHKCNIKGIIHERILKYRGQAASHPGQAKKPHFDEAEFNEMVAKGTQAWKDVPDATVWVEEQRGNDYPGQDAGEDIP